MSENQFEIPFIPAKEIKRRVEEFLQRYNPTMQIPVDIERIVEIDLGIEIRPVASLKTAFDIDGWLSRDMSTITVDKHQYDEVENRCRFTIAHELGHLILHREIYKQLEFENIDGWKKLILGFDPKKYGMLETQANIFAGNVLMPRKTLLERFSRQIETIREMGFNSNQFNLDLLNEYICRRLAEEYKVSEGAMRISLMNEKYI